MKGDKECTNIPDCLDRISEGITKIKEKLEMIKIG